MYWPWQYPVGLHTTLEGYIRWVVEDILELCLLTVYASTSLCKGQGIFMPGIVQEKAEIMLQVQFCDGQR